MADDVEGLEMELGMVTGEVGHEGRRDMKEPRRRNGRVRRSAVASAFGLK